MKAKLFGAIANLDRKSQPNQLDDQAVDDLGQISKGSVVKAVDYVAKADHEVHQTVVKKLFQRAIDTFGVDLAAFGISDVVTLFEPARLKLDTERVLDQLERNQRVASRGSKYPFNKLDDGTEVQTLDGRTVEKTGDGWGDCFLGRFTDDGRECRWQADGKIDIEWSKEDPMTPGMTLLPVGPWVEGQPADFLKEVAWAIDKVLAGGELANHAMSVLLARAKENVGCTRGNPAMTELIPIDARFKNVLQILAGSGFWVSKGAADKLQQI